MKTILTIGYRDFLIPDSVNISALLKSLSVAVPMQKKFHDGNYYYFPDKDRCQDLGVQIVKNEFVVDGKRKLIPEKSSVDSDTLL